MYLEERAVHFGVRILIIFMIMVAVVFIFSSCGYGASDAVDDSYLEVELNQAENAQIVPNIYLQEEKRGNTPGNIANRGYMALYGEWIFYFMLTDEESQIIKSSLDGSIKTAIFSSPRINGGTFDTDIRYLNIYDNWIYFYETQTRTIFRMKLDGAGIEALATAETASFSSVQVVDGWIYFIDEFMHPARMLLDGSERAVIIEERARGMQVSQRFVVYLSMEAGHLGLDYNLYKIRLEDNQKIGISDDNISHFIVENGFIFFTKSSEHSMFAANLYSMFLDGSNVRRISDSYLNPEISFGIGGGMIYYSQFGEEIGEDLLYRISFDGSIREQIGEKLILYVNVANGWIYCFSITEGAGFYKISILESLTEKLFSHH